MLKKIRIRVWVELEAGGRKKGIGAAGFQGVYSVPSDENPLQLGKKTRRGIY